MKTSEKHKRTLKIAHFWVIRDKTLQNKMNHWKVVFRKKKTKTNKQTNKNKRHAMTFLGYCRILFSKLKSIILVLTTSTILI